jgi:hypothetical protein
MPTVTEIKSGGSMNFGRILEANDGSIGLDLEVGCIVMMERSLQTLKVKRENN